MYSACACEEESKYIFLEKSLIIKKLIELAAMEPAVHAGLKMIIIQVH